MDDKTLKIEVPSRNQGSCLATAFRRIIWLPPGRARQSSALASKVACALRSDGRSSASPAVRGMRMTFRRTVRGNDVVRTSDVLGACHVDMNSVDQLSLERQIDQAVTRAAYQQWKLQYAWSLSSSGTRQQIERRRGSESAWWGSRRPDFDLELVRASGSVSRRTRGRSSCSSSGPTWCINCLQSSPSWPRLSKIVRRSRGRWSWRQSREPQQQWRRCWRRTSFSRVALDQDGGVAARYASRHPADGRHQP